MSHKFSRVVSLTILFLSLIVLSAAPPPQSSPTDTVLTELLRRLDLPAPSANADAASMFEVFAAHQTDQLSVSEVAFPAELSGGGEMRYTARVRNVIDAAEETYRYQFCESTAQVIITPVTPDTDRDLLTIANQGFEPLLGDEIAAARTAGMDATLDTVAYQGSQIHAASIPHNDPNIDFDHPVGRIDRAVWRENNWIFFIILKTTNYGRVGAQPEQIATLGYADCPLAFNPGPDLQTWYQTLHDVSAENGLTAPAPAPETPQYRLDCAVGWNQWAPLTFQIRPLDAKGKTPAITGGDYVQVRLSWNEQRTPYPHADSLLWLRPRSPYRSDHLTDYRHGVTNPIELNVLPDADGVIRLDARLDFLNIQPPISAKNPLRWRLQTVWMRQTPQGWHEKSLGYCDVQTDALAYVWGVAGNVAVDNPQQKTAPHLLQQDAVLQYGDMLTMYTADGKTTDDKSYAMFTYLDGTRFGVRGRCTEFNRGSMGLGCTQYLFGAAEGLKTGYGYILHNRIQQAIDEQVSDVLEDRLEVLVQKGLTAVSNIGAEAAERAAGLFISTVTTELANTTQMGTTAGEAVCAMPTYSPQTADRLISDYYRVTNIDTTPHLSCWGVNIHSLLTVDVAGETVTIKTYDGSPRVMNAFSAVDIQPGQQVVTDENGVVQAMNAFDPDPQQLDWLPELFQPEPDVAVTSSVVATGEAVHLTELPAWLWAVVSSLVCVGSIGLVIMVVAGGRLLAGK